MANINHRQGQKHQAAPQPQQVQKAQRPPNDQASIMRGRKPAERNGRHHKSEKRNAADPEYKR